jgi:hypothetical protein
MIVDWRRKRPEWPPVAMIEVCMARNIDGKEVSCKPSLMVDVERYRQAAEAAAAQGKNVDTFDGQAAINLLQSVVEHPNHPWPV